MKKTVVLVTWAVFPLVASNTIFLNRIGPSGSELFIANTDGTGERKLLGSSGFDYDASFSTDGKWIVFTSERNGSADIYRVRVDGRGLERLTDDPAYDDQASFSPDGNEVAFVSSRGSGTTDIWVLDLKTRKVRNLTNTGKAGSPITGPRGNFRPAWSPDGKWIAFSSDRNTEFRPHSKGWEHVQAANIYIVRPDGNGLRRLTSSDKFAGSPKWSADAKRVVFYEMAVEQTFAARRGVAAPDIPASQIVSVDITTGARIEHTSGAGLKVAPQFLSADLVAYLVKGGERPGLAFTKGERGAEGSMRNPAWSPDGKLVVYTKTSFAARPHGQPLFSKVSEFQLRYSDVFPTFSRDGRLAVTVFGGGLNDPSAPLAVMDADGSHARQIFHEKDGATMSPAWSPDGQWIAFGFGGFFTNRQTKPARVMMIRPDGSERKDLTRGPGNTGFPSWSPDGKRIVYRVWGGAEHGLRILNLEDGSVQSLTDDYDNFPSWSPNGDRIVFTRAFNHAFDIFSIRPDGSSLKQLTDAPGNDAHTTWSPDGKYLLFSSARFGFKDEAPLYDHAPQPYGELFVMNADGSGQRPLTDNNWEDATPAWQPVTAAQAKR